MIEELKVSATLKERTMTTANYLPEVLETTEAERLATDASLKALRMRCRALDAGIAFRLQFLRAGRFWLARRRFDARVALGL